MKGKLHASEEVMALLTIHKSSWHTGKLELNHSSILCTAFLILIQYHDIFCSYFFHISLSLSSVSS